ncbi:MAG: LamG-like jellyroll fold domain-containing protein, partial [Deltaproteobacteria bacterium]
MLGDAPSAYYPLDETSGTVVIDHGPNGLNGAYGSAVSLGSAGLIAAATSHSPSFPGGAAGAADTARVNPNGKLQPAAAFSVEFALLVHDGSKGAVIDLVSYGSQAAGQAFSVQLDQTGGLRLWLVTSAGAFGVDGVTALALDRAYLVDATYDGAKASLYLDGALEASRAVTGEVDYSHVAGQYGLSIGGGFDAGRQALDGGLAQLSIYGQALTAARLLAHFEASGLVSIGGGSSGGSTGASTSSGGSTTGGSTAGGSTAGGSTTGGSTTGGSTTGGSTAGGSTTGGSTTGGCQTALGSFSAQNPPPACDRF